jgi:hypothetical protein
MSQLKTIDIRPESSILSVLAHLNYKAWYAFGEYIDNSIQSFNTEKAAIDKAHGAPQRLRVSILLDNTGTGRITIRDNAGGISLKDFQRAFKAAQLPADRSGLSEFGMGMKSASFWFAKKWMVRTSAIGEAIERRVHFDITAIANDNPEKLNVIELPATEASHFTEIVLEDLHSILKTNTISKCKDHLRSIYRRFTDQGLLVLKLGDDELVYEQPEVMEEPEWGPDKLPIDDIYKRWYKEINFSFGASGQVQGWAALRDIGDVKRSGFGLFRRNRLIMGSDEDAYRPASIFGEPTDFVSQRLIGELDFTGVNVSHTKDGFQWGDDEEEFLEKLRVEINKAPLPLIRQARNFRARIRAKEIQQVADRVGDRTVQTLQTSAKEEVVRQAQPTPPLPTPTTLAPLVVDHEKCFTIDLDDGTVWEITIELVSDPAQGDLLEVADRASSGSSRSLTFRLALEHPFVRRHIGANMSGLEPIYQLAAALGLAEKTAMQSGKDLQAPRMLRNVGRILEKLAHVRQ